MTRNSKKAEKDRGLNSWESDKILRDFLYAFDRRV